jgi:ATP-dependent protease HslVU (ClpYQ) peptidase subunit
MTIIVALQADNGTYIASDSCLTAGDRQLSGNYSKWICYRSWALGFAGCWKVFNIIDWNHQRLLTGLKYPQDLVQKLENLLDHNGVGKDDDYVTDYGQNILIAKRNGPVWHLDPLLAFSEIPKGMLWGEGSGADFAIGSGYALSDRPPEERVRAAVDVAKEFCSSCGGMTFFKKL